jgi:hypothetical protein
MNTCMYNEFCHFDCNEVEWRNRFIVEGFLDLARNDRQDQDDNISLHHSVIASPSALGRPIGRKAGNEAIQF